jgi:hypothetical protein
MNRAGKWAIYVLIAIVVLLLIAVAVFFLVGDNLIKIAVEKGGNYALKVPVDVNKVHLSVLKASIEIDGLRIGNPPGYAFPELLNMGQARAAVKISSLTSDVVDIDYVTLDKVSMVVEQKGFGTNLQEIMKKLPQTPEQAQKTQQAPGKKLRIKTLEISNVNVTLKLLPIPGKSSAMTIKLAPIKMENLGTDSPMSMATLTSKILLAIAEGVSKQAYDLLPKGLTDSLQTGVGKSGQLLQQGSKGVLDVGKGIGKGISGIFVRKTEDANQQ